MSVAVWVVAAFFAIMGGAALVRPALIWAPFGVAPTTPAARNEIRAVYGGFGIAIAVLLVLANDSGSAFRDGVLLATAVALAGMAAGRVIALLAEPRSIRGYPALFLLIEAVLAGLLVAAALPLEY